MQHYLLHKTELARSKRSFIYLFSQIIPQIPNRPTLRLRMLFLISPSERQRKSCWLPYMLLQLAGTISTLCALALYYSQSHIMVLLRSQAMATAKYAVQVA